MNLGSRSGKVGWCYGFSEVSRSSAEKHATGEDVATFSDVDSPLSYCFYRSIRCAS